MDLVYYYWTTWLLILVSTSLASYSPSSGDLVPKNKMTRVLLMLTLLKAWIVLYIMTTLDATMASLTTKIVGVLLGTYLHLHEIPPPLVKYLIDYGRTWASSDNCIILHPYFATSTDCYVASDTLSVCYSCCSVCKPPSAARNSPEVVHTIVSKEVLPGPDVTTIYLIDMFTTSAASPKWLLYA